MIRATELARRVGGHGKGGAGFQLIKNWGASWTLAFVGETRSVWFNQEVIEWNEAEMHQGDKDASQEQWAKFYLGEYDQNGDDFPAGVLVLANGLTPENLRKLENIRVGQDLERWNRNAERKRAGLI